MYLIIDLETSGLPDYALPADHPAQPRIASVAMITADADLVPQEEFYALVQPEGWTLGEEAAAVNGLTMQQLRAEGIPIADILHRYIRHIATDQRCVVGHNTQHELKLMRGELRRLGLPDLFEATRNICTMRGATGVCRLPKAKGAGYKFPKLSEAYRHFHGRDFEGAHTALGDARACLAVAQRLNLIGCLPDPAVFHAKEGTKAGAALAARSTPAEEAAPGEEAPHG